MEDFKKFNLLPHHETIATDNTMEQKHTPGPWKVRYMKGEDDPEAGFFVEAKHTHPDAAYGIDILCDGDAYYPWQQRLADAKLIASAPELLEQLKQLKEENEHKGDLMYALGCRKVELDNQVKSLTEQVEKLKGQLNTSADAYGLLSVDNSRLREREKELVEYNNNLEKTLRICLTVQPHTKSVDTMKAMVKTLLDESLLSKVKQ